MYGCFAGCISLVYLNIENWVINERCDTTHIFNECNNLSLIKCSKNTFKRILSKGWIYENGYAIKCGMDE